MTTDPRPRRWDHHSGVTECETCDGSGLIDKTPLNRVYRDPPGTWDEPCPDCEEQGVVCCPVCGWDQVVPGYDCWVCSSAYDLPASVMKAKSPADLADCFAAAFNAALNAKVTA
jgi:hypothetical protein